MLWLEQDCANLGGKSKMVTFKVPGLLGFCFLGDRWEGYSHDQHHACVLVVVGRIGMPSLFFLAHLRELSLCRITLLWVDILVCCPVELFGTPPVREIGLLWSWCLTQLLSHVFLVAVCFRVGRVVEQLAELLD